MSLVRGAAFVSQWHAWDVVEEILLWMLREPSFLSHRLTDRGPTSPNRSEDQALVMIYDIQLIL